MRTSAVEKDFAPPTPPADAADTRKRRQILDGARAVFLRDGFDGASMNDITRAAGVSKGTIYAYFPSKEALFETLIREDRRAQAERICDFDPANRDVRGVLTTLGANLMDVMTRPGTMAHLRTVIAAAARFPQIGRAFYEAGPGYGIERLAAYFDHQNAAGTLAIADTRRAAAQFFELCQAGHMKPMLFAVIDRPAPAAIAQSVESAVEIFLRAYAAPAAKD